VKQLTLVKFNTKPTGGDTDEVNKKREQNLFSYTMPVTISWQSLPLVSSMGPRYAWQLLYSENSQKRINSTTTEARGKVSAYLESLEFHKNIDSCLTTFKHNQILLNRIFSQFLVTTKLFTGWNVPVGNMKNILLRRFA
jgi:hypothetical protein